MKVVEGVWREGEKTETLSEARDGIAGGHVDRLFISLPPLCGTVGGFLPPLSQPTNTATEEKIKHTTIIYMYVKAREIALSRKQVSLCFRAV